MRSRDEVGYLAAAFNDLTARRERIEEQRKAMVGDIAHELRNPLNVIRGRLEAAEDGHLPFDRALTASLLEETVLLQHIVDDLQDLAAADAGQLRLHPEPLDAAELADHVAAAHADRAAAAGVWLTVSADGEAALTADPVRLRQVVGNLVTNAIRHTPPSGHGDARRRGHWHRHRRRGPAARVRPVLARREVPQPADRRQRARPGHRAPPRPSPRRHPDGRVRSGHRIDVHRPPPETGITRD